MIRRWRNSGDRFEPIEPLWPLVGTEVELRVTHFTSPWLNGILLAVALLLAALLSRATPTRSRFQPTNQPIPHDRSSPQKYRIGHRRR